MKRSSLSAERLEARARLGPDEPDQVERGLLAGVEAVLGDEGHVEERADHPGRADAVEVFGDREAVQQRRAVAVGYHPVGDDLRDKGNERGDDLGLGHLPAAEVEGMAGVFLAARGAVRQREPELGRERAQVCVTRVDELAAEFGREARPHQPGRRVHPPAGAVGRFVDGRADACALHLVRRIQARHAATDDRDARIAAEARRRSAAGERRGQDEARDAGTGDAEERAAVDSRRARHLDALVGRRAAGGVDGGEARRAAERIEQGRTGHGTMGRLAARVAPGRQTPAIVASSTRTCYFFSISFPVPMRLSLALLLAAAALPASAQTPDPASSARALVEAVRARHGATWYRTLTFAQETTLHTPAGPQVQTWFEAASIPGHLRIDVVPLGAAGTFLFTSDSTHLARPGHPAVHRAGGNPLLLLGFDIVALPASETLAGMAALSIDTTAVRADVWDGRPMIVVGGSPGDSTALGARVQPQVWFDRERLVFVRLVERDGAAVSDVRFLDYAPLGGGWVSPHVEAYQNGALAQEERYRAIQADVALPEGTFDPRSWPSVAWWTAAGYDGTE